MRVSGALFNSFKPSDHCLVRIKDAFFKLDSHYASKPGQQQAHLFPQPIRSFEIYRPVTSQNGQIESQLPSLWAVTGAAKTKFLNVLAGKYIPSPPTSRTYPFMAEQYRYDQIQLLNFRESSGLDAVHMSARYESYSYKGKLEMSDDVNSVKNYITGNNNYNTNKSVSNNESYVQKLMHYFNLTHLEKKWINSLSNGQLRRARLAKALIDRPSLLIIDDPFLGLDPEATQLVSESLFRVSQELSLSIVVGLRVQDSVPSWVTHVAYAIDQDGVKYSGDKKSTLPLIENDLSQVNQLHSKHQQDLHTNDRQLQPIKNEHLCPQETPHIEFNNASVIYKNLPVLQNFSWRVGRGTNWRILGNNGTGKTTLLSLITADHPQSWRSVISINGVLRKTGNGVTFFDVNNKIGISSPELHALVPGMTRTMKDIIFNGLVKDVGNSNFLYRLKPDTKLSEWASRLLAKFDDRLSIVGDTKFGELSISDQKLCLFLRAIIKQPEILILDEAFSCMDDEGIMIRCHDVVAQDLQDTTVLAIGHIDWEVPQCDYLLKLTGDEHRSYQLSKYV